MENENSIEEYPWSVITKKILILLEVGIGLRIAPDQIYVLEDEVIEYQLQDPGPSQVHKFLDVLISGEEHDYHNFIEDETSMTNLNCALSEFESVIGKNMLKRFDYGEWELWHLPLLGYGAFIQREASPTYFWTAKRLLDVSFKEMVNDYSFRK